MTSLDADSLLEMPIIWAIIGIYATLSLGYLMVAINRGRADAHVDDAEDEDEEI